MSRTDFSFERLIALFEQTHGELQRRAARSVNLALVVRNWLFGWYIVEYEQAGSDRAEYGERLIESLSEALKDKGMKGISKTNLWMFRSFYLTRKGILQSLPEEFTPLPLRQESSQIRQTVPDESPLPR